MLKSFDDNEDAAAQDDDIDNDDVATSFIFGPRFGRLWCALPAATLRCDDRRPRQLQLQPVVRNDNQFDAFRVTTMVMPPVSHVPIGLIDRVGHPKLYRPLR